MIKLDELVAQFASFVWGLPLIILLIGGGFYLLVISKFLPFRYLGHAFQVLRGKYDNPDDSGGNQSFSGFINSIGGNYWYGKYCRSSWFESSRGHESKKSIVKTMGFFNFIIFGFVMA
jgi:hypothetical protein